MTNRLTRKLMLFCAVSSLARRQNGQAWFYVTAIFSQNRRDEIWRTLRVMCWKEGIAL